MLDGTPIPDIKPYLSNVPSDKLKRGWLAEAADRESPDSAFKPFAAPPHREHAANG